MHQSHKLTLIGYCSSLALILATANLATAQESSIPDTANFNWVTALQASSESETAETIDNTKDAEQVALSTGGSDEKTTDGDRCICMGYSNFCLNCHHAPEGLG